MTNEQPQPTQWDEGRRWIHEQRRSEAERAHDRVDQQFAAMNDAAIKASSLAVRTALLINGGAAIALISFIGHLPPSKMKTVAETIIWFAWGVVASASALVLAYFTHYSMAGFINSHQRSYDAPFVTAGATTNRWLQWKRFFHISAALCGLLSIVLFILGMFEVRDAFLN